MSEDPILDAFSRRLEATPEAPIVVTPAGTTRVEDLARLARDGRRQLTDIGVGPGALVGLVAANGPAYLAGLLAIRGAGAAALLLDAAMPVAARQATARCFGCRHLLIARGSRRLALQHLDSATTPAAAAALDADVAVVKLTSGSTGQPRGIVTPSAALVADEAALASTMGLRDDERILAAIPMSHSYGLSSVVMPALMRHATLVVPSTANPLDPLRMAQVHGVTFLPTVPAYLQALMRRASPPRLASCLRLVVTAGAPLTQATAARFEDHYGQPIHVFYGASECGGITFDRSGTAGLRGALGTPVDGVAIELEAVAPAGGEPGEAGEPGAGGERGRVVVRSAAVARGYLPLPDPDLGDGRFKTRDLGALHGGELILEGRLDTLVNVRGKKVNPHEVEIVLARMPGVEDVVAIGGEVGGEPLLRAFVAAAPGVLSYASVQAWCRRYLAEHKVPRSIILLETIPRSARGKVDHRALGAHTRSVAAGRKGTAHG